MLNLNFTPFPVLTTNRLVLIEPKEEHVNNYYLLRSNKEIMYALDKNPSNIEESTKLFLKTIENHKNNLTINWLIYDKTTNEFLGDIGYYKIDTVNHRAEVGYSLFFKNHRKGIMNEALNEVINYGFKTINLHSICACINPNNTASKHLLLKNGFLKEAYFKQDYYYNGRYLDSEYLSLLNPNHK
jgi:[ribosomal protein S5]-alanine N-acetyltransferase